MKLFLNKNRFNKDKYTNPLFLNIKRYNTEENIPLLLKKISKKRVTKPLTYIRSDTGKTRHFTPAAQE
jgi:hypothetical protein